MESPAIFMLGDKSTSDVVVRVLAGESRDYRFHCHRQVLVEKSKFFADRLSEKASTRHFLDSLICVEVHCHDSDLDHLVNLLRVLYVSGDNLMENACTSVKNAIGILRMAMEYGCPRLITVCVSYLEAVPWEEGEEDEILKVIPQMGSQVEPVLARLQPVNSVSVKRIFLSAAQFAMSSPTSSKTDLKVSAQEQLEYMLAEDDDAPMLMADEETKSEVKRYAMQLFSRFRHLLETFSPIPEESDDSEDETPTLILSFLSDMLWTFQFLSKMESLKDYVNSWVDSSDKIIEAIDKLESPSTAETKYKLIEIAAKILDAIGYGSVILPTSKRLHMVSIWLPFVRSAKNLLDSLPEGGDPFSIATDNEVWQSLQSTFVSIILTLPSEDQAGILTEWLESKHVVYPDLTEAFEIWCYRSKVAKGKMEEVRSLNGVK